MPINKSSELPGFLHTFFETVLGLMLGIVFAAAFLIFKPVAVADGYSKEDPEAEHALHDVTYVKGREGSVSRLSWQAAYRRFLGRSPDGLKVSEQDVNRWVSLTYGEMERTIARKEVGAEMRLGLPLFRFADDHTEIGVALDFVVPGKSWKFIVQAKGDFVATSEGMRFQPDEMYVGSLRIPKQFCQELYDALALGYPVPEDAKPVFAAVDEVGVEGGKLNIRFPRPRTVDVEVAAKVEAETVEDEMSVEPEVVAEATDEAFPVSDEIVETADDLVGETGLTEFESGEAFEEPAFHEPGVEVAPLAQDVVVEQSVTDLAQTP